MKLAKVDHDRCGEWAGTTYLWIPDELTAPEFRAAVIRARDKYLATWDEWSKSGPEPAHPGSSQLYIKPGDYSLDTTLEEIIADKESKRKAYVEWDRVRHDASQNFGYWLKLEIPESKWLHEEAIPQANINWGHRHSQAIELTFTNTHDLAGATRGFSIDSGIGDELF